MVRIQVLCAMTFVSAFLGASEAADSPRRGTADAAAAES